MIVVLIVIASLLVVFGIVRFVTTQMVLKTVFENDHQVATTPESVGLLFEELSIRVVDHTIKGWLVRTEDKTGAVALILHGQNETLSNWIHVQKFFFEHGITTLVIDYAAYGASTGKGVIRDLPRDVHAAFEALKTAEDLEKNKGRQISIIGFSLGAAALLQDLDFEGRKPDKIVLCEAFSSIRSMAVDHNEIPRNLAWLIPDVLNNEKAIKINTLPTMVIHSNGDEVTSAYHGEKLAAACARVPEKVILDGFKHNDLWQNPAGGYWDPVLKFVKE